METTPENVTISRQTDVVKLKPYLTCDYTWLVRLSIVRTFQESEHIFSCKIFNNSFMKAEQFSNKTESFQFTG